MAPVSTEAVLTSAIRQSIPLVLGALCGLLGERSGIINIGIEGQMLAGAFTGFVLASWTGNLYAGVLTGVIAGSLMGFLLGFLSIRLQVDQIISGTVINILAFGVTGYLYQPGMAIPGKLSVIPLGSMVKLPLVSPLFIDHAPIAFITPLLVLGCHFGLRHTRWGLRTRAVGEHPKAADTMGLMVHRIQFVNLGIAGMMSGLGGAFLALEAVGSFERGMTNGRGFVALAIMIFGRWKPIPAWLGAILFGLASALQTQLQFGGGLTIPHQFIGMLPYLLTIVVLVLFVGRARPPADLGLNYRKEM